MPLDHEVAMSDLDRLSFVIQECTYLTSFMRKSTKSYGGLLASVLRSQFLEESPLDEDSEDKFPSFLKSATKFKDDDHFLSGLVELRSILSEVQTLDEIDILTLLQPFLLLIRSPEISCKITSLTVNSLSMFLKYGIISSERKNIHQCMAQIVSALSHCRFEGSDQSQDDVVLVKIIRLLESIALSDLGEYLKDDSMYEIVSTCFSVAINNKRGDMLRNAAQISLINLTEKIFSKLKYIKFGSQDEENHNVKSTNFELSSVQNGELPDDTIGGTIPKDLDISSELHKSTDNDDKTDHKNDDEKNYVQEKSTSIKTDELSDNPSGKKQIDSFTEEADEADDAEFKMYGLPCMRELLIHTVDIISPQNALKFTEGTKLLSLELLCRIIEVSGSELHRHPSIFHIISDRGCHHLLKILRTTSSINMLSQTLKAFLDLFFNSPESLKLQFEAFFQAIADNIVAKWPQMEDDLDKMNSTVFEMTKKGKFEVVSLSEKEVTELSKEFDTLKPSVFKELLIETLSVLWCRSQYLFINLFKVYDCNFERSDICLNLIKILCRLSASDASLFTTSSVPPICMEGILSFIDSMFERVHDGIKKHIALDQLQCPKLLKQRSKKADFISCIKVWNKKPKKGLEMLQNKGFISNIHDDDEVAQFLYEKSGRIDKKELGELLAKPSNINILKKFIDFMDFKNLRPDEALRKLLNNFRLPGEAQEIERIVECFNDRYIECQDRAEVSAEPSEKTIIEKENVSVKTKDEDDHVEDDSEEQVAPDKDAMFVLSFSIIMLNTDLHNPNVKKPMTLLDYQRNLRGCYNGGNFPSWYTERIYNSIKEREIIMPEDFKGSNKWFESKWHALIGEFQSKIDDEDGVKSFVTTNDEDLRSLLQFDARIFQKTARYIISTLINMFDTDTHDGIVIRMMSTVEKCAAIAKFFGFDDIVNSIIDITSHMTTLTGLKKQKVLVSNDEEISSVTLKVKQQDKPITVSKLSVEFGRDFKAQVGLITLLHVLKRSDYNVSPEWKQALECLFELFRHSLVNPNSFPEFQVRLELEPLMPPKGDYVINKDKITNEGGLLSTFSSYFKGLSDDTPEPTEEEIESTLSTLECISSSGLSNLLRNVSKTESSNIDAMVELLLDYLPDEKSSKVDEYIEQRSLYILETCVCYLLLSRNQKLISMELERCKLLTHAELGFSTKSMVRIITYELLLLHNGNSEHNAYLSDVLGQLMLLIKKNKERLVQIGATLLQPLQVLLLSSDCWCRDRLLGNSDYWSIFRCFASSPKNTARVYEFIEGIIHEQRDLVQYKNYMDVLGLLDEISAVGAYGAQWEQERDKLISKGVDVSQKKNPFEKLVSTSLKSISLTGKLGQILKSTEFQKSMKHATPELDKKGHIISPWYPLIEAISHQCYNPCRELRNHALKTLTTILLSNELPMDELSSEAVMESGCFRLLEQLCEPDVTNTDPNGMMKTQQNAINLSCKAILLYKFKNPNHEVIRLLNITDKLLQKNSKNRDFKEETLEIEKNALRVKISEYDIKQLESSKISLDLKRMLLEAAKGMNEASIEVATADNTSNKSDKAENKNDKLSKESGETEASSKDESEVNNPAQVEDNVSTEKDAEKK